MYTLHTYLCKGIDLTFLFSNVCKTVYVIYNVYIYTKYMFLLETFINHQYNRLSFKSLSNTKINYFTSEQKLKITYSNGI